MRLKTSKHLGISDGDVSTKVNAHNNDNGMTNGHRQPSIDPPPRRYRHLEAALASLPLLKELAETPKWKSDPPLAAFLRNFTCISCLTCWFAFGSIRPGQNPG